MLISCMSCFSLFCIDLTNFLFPMNAVLVEGGIFFCMKKWGKKNGEEFLGGKK